MQYKNRIDKAPKKVKGAKKGRFGRPSLLCLVLRIVAKLNHYTISRRSLSILLVSLLITFMFSSWAFAMDKYNSFEELEANEPSSNYRVFANSIFTPVLILAPHGGGIEGGTSELALEFSHSYSTYLFESLKIPGAFDLHITSTNFNEPQALNMVSKSNLTISLHGYASNDEHTLVGGTDRETAEMLVTALNHSGFSAELLPENSPLSGTDPDNIANRNRSGKSIQLEISTGQRRAMFNNFSIAGRFESKNENFYKFTNLLSEFIDRINLSPDVPFKDIF